MTSAAPQRRLLALASASVAAGLLVGAGSVRADSTPIGALPAGPVTSTTTKAGQLVAVALPKSSDASGLVWRLARSYDSTVVKEVSEGDLGSSVVLVFKVVGRGDASLVFALTRGDASSKALKSVRYRIHST